MRTQFSIRILFELLLAGCCFLAGWTFQGWGDNSGASRVRVVRDESLDAEPGDIEYHPESFKNDLRVLIDARDFSTAVALLDAVYIDDQINFENNENHFFAVAGYKAVLPGANREFDFKKDWIIPCSSESILWFERAERFAKKYNCRVIDKRNASRSKNK